MMTKYTGWVCAAAFFFLGFTLGRPAATRPALPFDATAARQHVIPVHDAAAYARNFTRARDTVYRGNPGLKAQLDLPNSESFNRDAIAALLEARDSSGNPAAGVRVYLGLDSAGHARLVLVPYDSRRNDILTRLSTHISVAPDGVTAEVTGADAVENGARCPDVCPPDSGLSSVP